MPGTVDGAASAGTSTRHVVVTMERPLVWDHVPLPLLPMFTHHCIDLLCGRDAVGSHALVPDAFANEEALTHATSMCQQSLMHWIDIRDKNDVSPLLYVGDRRIFFFFSVPPVLFSSFCMTCPFNKI